MFTMSKICFLVFLVKCVNGAAITCGLNQYTLKDASSNTVDCIDCPLCPRGMGSVPQCGAFLRERVEPTCKPCTVGVFYSLSRDVSSCESCTICVENEIVIKNCTPTSNTICGKCKPGYYHSFVHSCEKCSPCCEDTQDEDIEQQCLNQGFPKHSACRYTDRQCRKIVPNPTHRPKNTNFEEDKQTSSSTRWGYICGGIAGLVLIMAVGTVLVICRKKSKDIPLMKTALQECGEEDSDGSQQVLRLPGEQNLALDETELR